MTQTSLSAGENHITHTVQPSKVNASIHLSLEMLTLAVSTQFAADLRPMIKTQRMLLGLLN